MKTLTADSYKRIRIPAARLRQTFTYTTDSNGIVTLTPVNCQTKDTFPPGSLLKYMTAERDKEDEAILAGCATRPE